MSLYCSLRVLPNLCRTQKRVRQNRADDKNAPHNGVVRRNLVKKYPHPYRRQQDLDKGQ